jgi:hypothetical protein
MDFPRRGNPRRPDRWRAYRARVRAGLMVPQMTGIGAAEISFLVETKWLHEIDDGDRCAVVAVSLLKIPQGGERGW